ncbi:transmembrane protein 161B [Strongylocentrotus purpuratus]|uniref:Transmembrane protein 161B n=1 Tax=Strongylocentrotus purpuratus TaxID=7668 RepID=A0A7M7RG26_STRPU|nr:transmembrane protein 161B [Strongylocentrotus purpuratus]|eukprot:XP_790739.2 PREDICTED: transmembrane protein 161B [Strongylocentrotus purpuratus]
MPLLGPQLVFTLVMSSIMQKVIVPYHSFAQWLLARGNLKYFNYPSDDDLKKAAGIIQSRGRHKRNRPENFNKRNGAALGDQTFTVPKNIDIDLGSETLQPSHLLTIRYYGEFKWLLDFTVMATVVYTVTEAYYALVDTKGDLNLSLIWMVMGLLFTLHVLFSLTSLYFKSDDAGEMVLCVTFGFLFLIVAMAVIVIDENYLEFGVDDAYDDFLQGAHEHLAYSELESQGPMSRTTFEFLLAFVAALLGAFMTFPGLRLAKMHIDALKYNAHLPHMQILLHTSFLFPLLIALLWVKPIARDYVRSPTLGKKVNMTGDALMSDETFDIVRISFIPLFALIRLALMTQYLQAYLNMAHERIEQMRKEAGRINSLDLQKKVIRVFYYLCVVALQYIAPVILLFCFSCLLKTSAGYSYGVFDHFQSNATNASATAMPNSPPSPSSSSSSSSSSTIADDVAAFVNPVREAKAQLAFALSVLKHVFSPVFFKGIFSFLIWWVCVTWFITSSFGLAFHSYVSTNS